MNVKVYEGKDFESVVEKAKKELGEDAYILYYEVEKRGIPPFRKKYFRVFFSVNGGKQKEGESVQEIQKVEKEIEELKQLVSEIKNAVENQSSVPLPVPEHIDNGVFLGKEILTEFTGDAVELIQILVKKGVKPEVAAEIVKESCGLDIETEKLDLNTSSFKEALLKGISAKINFTGDFQPKEGEKVVYAFVGPTGVGKTTNLFKLASKFVIEEDLKVGIITTDTFKVAAVQQVREYAHVLNIPYFVVSDSKKMKEVMEKIEDLDVILIDTVGRSHYDYWRLGEIKVTLSGLNVPLNVVLLVSCNYETSEAVEVVNRYRSFFPVNALFLTKLDETSKPGNLLNLPFITSLPLSYISTGQRVPEDLKVLSPEVITDILLGK
ncbi:flagellar biosynthesis protein FlhF [Desulfurobacterium pacificum]|uniref:Flagellar biosynthesis protein FlhF n=1 Tax=Desulfurobacterium pacificum TaxID=240166 RepID=A0ABY1NNB7_9BACT|nr:flagellar biosynthesis protein FlhF [Desulfurobacterium pacificum]SMP13750.1 flagellar biosynthesis protein FlhF [Desulfurobacterium pacificum]